MSIDAVDIWRDALVPIDEDRGPDWVRERITATETRPTRPIGKGMNENGREG
jgi:hypothetical protein